MSTEKEIHLNFIMKYRDRYTVSSIFVMVLSLLLLLWVTAPSLNISIPMLGGASVNINVGYVLSGGIPLISFLCLWNLGWLEGINRLQRRIVLNQKNYALSNRLLFFGPLTPNQGHSPSEEKRAHIGIKPDLHFVASWTRIGLFVFIPFLAQLAILNGYFQLKYTTMDQLKSTLSREGAPQGFAGGSRAVPFFTRMNFESACLSGGNECSGRESRVIFFVEDSTLQGLCTEAFVPEVERDVAFRQDCVYANFPRFSPLLNTVVNILFFLLSALVTLRSFMLLSGSAARKMIDEEGVSSASEGSES